ncbi:MAG: hypothetical protein Q4D14_03355 [Bacteroidales bacterium]|nr:hypothetical protein [Bacteroidales bacterium]
MKGTKGKMLAMLLLALLTATACVGPRGPQGPQGPQGEPGEGTNWKIINLTVPANAWVEYADNNNQNNYYRALFDVPEINDFIYNSGLVICYHEVNNSQIILPYVRHNQDQDGNYWTTTVDFDYAVGSVAIYVTHSDFADDPPGEMNFRLVLMW